MTSKKKLERYRKIAKANDQYEPGIAGVAEEGFYCPGCKNTYPLKDATKDHI